MKHNKILFSNNSVRILKMFRNLSQGARFGKNINALIVLLACLFLAPPVLAKNSPVNRMQSSEARELTLRAIKAIEKGRWDDAHEYIAESQDPLASKIYLWLLLTDSGQANWTNHLFIKISRFIRHNPEWPKIKSLKKRAEQVMPEDLSNDEVIAWFADFPPQTSVGMGRYMDAMIINGKLDRAREFMTQWWARTVLTKKQQSQIFKKYGGYLTVEAHKKRFDALLYKKKYSAAREIGNVLGQGYPALAEARIGLRKNAAGVGVLIDKVPSYLQNDAGLLYERLHWRRKKGVDDGALEILSLEIDPKDVLNPSDWWAERHRIVRGLIERGEYEKAYQVSSKHFQKEGLSYAQAQWLTGWLALRFMNKPKDAFERFSAMYVKVKTPISKSRAAYWAARAAKDMKQKYMVERWFKRAAEFQTTYYGQLARAELSLKHNMPKSKLPRLSETVRENYMKSELVQASDIFRDAGMERRSSAFLNAFLLDDALVYNKGWLTQRPKYNIDLGSSYISRLIDRYDGSYILAIAAYNAGPSRVNRWIKKNGDLREAGVDEVDWVELIPIYETRNYVQRVMEGLYIYRLRLKGIQKQPPPAQYRAKHTQP